MRQILIIGAGRSASSLIQYLLNKSNEENLHLTIGDLSMELAQRKTNNHPNATAIALDINNAVQRQAEIQKADIVISMLPAHMHIEVAKDCVAFQKNMVTASYISDAMQSLDAEVKAKGLVFMNEIGLDPGIDHMSAMKVIDDIKAKGGKMILFESFCGGLVAPESDTNLWNYKFTWAPRNVVLAGQGGAMLVGVDLKKDPAVLHAAYNDAQGVTAAFNLNLLTRINRELGADFDVDAFRHEAIWNAAIGRIEMHLVSRRAQSVRLLGRRFDLRAGETIHTENSHKYRPAAFHEMAARAGWGVADWWSDPAGLFSVHELLRA